MSWPIYPSNENPYFGDGKTYGQEMGRVSPEGNILGHRRIVRDVEHLMWWNGEQWLGVEVSGKAESKDNLPYTDRPFGEIWIVLEQLNTGEKKWFYYFWDSENREWKPLKRRWDVDSFSELPTPGFEIGEAHLVREKFVEYIWTGYEWERFPRHSAILDDEPERHLPPGFIQMLAPDARVVFRSPREIGIESVPGGSGKVWVKNEWVEINRTCSVFNNLTVIDPDGSGLKYSYIEPDTEYFIYLANTSDPAFITDGLPGDETHNPAPKWDFKGKLFLSNTQNTDGYLSAIGAGQNARLVGRIQTDTTSKEQGGPFFIRELEISLISQTTNFPETYRDYSDYTLDFADENTLRFKKLDGLYGQIAINRSLYFLGVDFDIQRNAAWIDWNDSSQTKISRRTEPLQSNTLYYIYIASDIDEFNFNTINPNTNRPWMADDLGSELYYDQTLDYRLRPFLSSKSPEHSRMSDQWPGYEARHIGQIRTDANGRFIPSLNISAIRQKTLDPTFFDGLAEASFYAEADILFKIHRKRGTSGVVIVGGEAILTYERDDYRCHKVYNSDIIQQYTENNLTSPLSSLDPIYNHPNETLYVYLANNRSFWGEYKGKIFVSNHAPVNGYLSQNWPGNNARWMATIRPDINGKFTGNYVLETLTQTGATINDASVNLSETWSSSKINSLIQQIHVLISAASALSIERTSGLQIVVEYYNANQIRIRPINNNDITIVFPDNSTRVIPANGIITSLSGSPNTFYYLYMSQNSIFVSTTAPTTTYTYPGIQEYENNILIGWLAFSSDGNITGPQNIYSFWNQPTQIFGPFNINQNQTVPPGYTFSSYIIEGTITYFLPLSGSLIVPLGSIASVTFPSPVLMQMKKYINSTTSQIIDQIYQNAPGEVQLVRTFSSEGANTYTCISRIKINNSLEANLPIGVFHSDNLRLDFTLIRQKITYVEYYIYMYAEYYNVQITRLGNQ